MTASQIEENPEVVRRLQKQLCYAQRTIPYYRELFKRIKFAPADVQSLSDLKKLPLLTKADVRLQPVNFRNQRLPFNQSSRSSGSTGEPFSTSFDIVSWIRKKYWLKALNRLNCGVAIGDRIGILECSDHDSLASKNRLVTLAWPWLKIRFFSLFEPPENTLEALRKFKPDNLCGYAGHLTTLAALLENGATRLSPIKRLFTASECLLENNRRFLESVFDAPIFDHYGSTEFKEIAWQCGSRDAYHVNTREVIVEIVQPHAPDQWASRGDIVVTDLRNRAMPLIRYLTGDSGCAQSQCRCGNGSSMLKLDMGRSSDQLVTADKGNMSPYRITTELEKFSDLVQFQLVQTQPGAARLKTVWSEPPGETRLASLSDCLQSTCAESLLFTIEIADKIPPETNGKTRVLKQHLNNNECY